MTIEETNGAPMIEAVGLSKFYGDFAAIRDVTFSVPQGQVAAFLGPNGAGKSTTMKLLTGYLSASEGSARIAGFDVAERRLECAARLGYLPENGPLYPEMTPLSLLRFFGEARGISGSRLKQRIEAVADQCGLDGVLEKTISKLSKGYRQRVGMAQVLLHEPDVLVMDEPTAGLDPNQIRQVRSLIRDQGRTKTVLLSTHILQEVEAVADHVILIAGGRVVFDGQPAEMVAGHASMDEAFYVLTGEKSPAPAPVAAPAAAETAPVAAAEEVAGEEEEECQASDE
jgi:ABC-2 type transport system ATP-binding protein